MAPVGGGGWALLGELAKWVPTAPARVAAVQDSATGIEVDIVGDPGEVVVLHFAKAKPASGAGPGAADVGRDQKKSTSNQTYTETPHACVLPRWAECD